MDEYIKKEDAINFIEEKYHLYHDKSLVLALHTIFAEFMWIVPTVRLRKIKNGYWIDKGHKYFMCSECHTRFHILKTWKWCPVCGARMDGERKEE